MKNADVPMLGEPGKVGVVNTHWRKNIYIRFLAAGSTIQTQVLKRKSAALG